MWISRRSPWTPQGERFYDSWHQNLPVECTEGSSPFQVIGVDYAGPIVYRMSKRKERKPYILLFACSLSNAIHLELLTDRTTEGFIRCLKKFIARRGWPSTIYSDNGKSFVAAEKWLRKIIKEEKLQDYLAHHDSKWKFNLAKACWWGGQSERLFGSFTWRGDPETDTDAIEETRLWKRARYLCRKNVLWLRWRAEYVNSLRERHNLKHQNKRLSLKGGDVVLIQNEQRNRGKWNIGVAWS